MSRALALLLLLLPGGCGPSDAEIAEKARADERTAIKAKQEADAEAQNLLDQQKAAEEQRERAQRINDAQAFINTHLRQVAVEGETVGLAWSISIRTLAQDQWRWAEREVAYAGDSSFVGAIAQELNYRVDPRQLSATVSSATYRGLPAVRLECRSGNCIHVTGQRRLGSTESDISTERVDERASENYWPVRDSQESGRVAQAVSDLLSLQGARQSRY